MRLMDDPVISTFWARAWIGNAPIATLPPKASISPLQIRVFLNMSALLGMAFDGCDDLPQRETCQHL
jgi:hypothetical protein